MDIHRTPWTGREKVILHTTISKIRSYPDYAAAKSGDFTAARRLVSMVYKPGKIISRPDFIVPVLQVDREKQNAIPLALAFAIAKDIGGKVWWTCHQTNQVNHTGADAPTRITEQPTFSGIPPQSGTCLICDDVTTYGSTLANLRGYLQHNGLGVVDYTSLSAGYGSTELPPDASVINRIKDTHGQDLIKLTNRIGFPPELLTNREARFLAGIKTAHDLREKFPRELGAQRAQGAGW